jgi:PAS domain S-box-containing protein
MNHPKIKLLFVEDDKVDQIAFKRSVQAEGLPYDYSIAGSFSETKRILDSEKFDIIITDYLLGDGTAFDVLALSKDTPVIFATGVGDQETAVEAMRKGARDYLIKDPERKYLQVLPLTVESAIKSRRAEEKFRLLSHALTSSKDSVYITGMDNKFVLVNKSFCETYGYVEEEVLGKHVSVLETVTIVSSETIQSTWEGETYHRRKDGSEFPVSVSRSIITNENGDGVAIVAIARDITERKRAEKALQASEKKYKTLVETAHEGIAIVDPQERLTFVNQAFADVLGYQKEDILGLDLTEITDKDQFEQFQRESNRRKEGISSRYEARLRTKSGRVKYFSLSASPVFDEKGKYSGALGLFADITEQKGLELQIREYAHSLEKANRELEDALKGLKDTQTQLVQAEKMAAVGQLAAGLAHELNNPLGGILGYSQFGLEKINQKPINQFDKEDIDCLVGYLKDIEHQTKRCRSIIKSLLEFSRASRGDEFTLTDINVAIEESLKLTLPQAEKSNVTLVKRLSQSLPKIAGNSDQLQQVFVNLIVNAVQAMPEGGTLTVNSAIGLDPKTVKVCFTDTGVGISADDLDKIFEPFFTTKKMGEGSGLGLSVSYGLIKDHGGEIQVESKEGEGSTFTVILPIFDDTDDTVLKSKLEISAEA